MNESSQPQPPHRDKPAGEAGAAPARMSIVAAHLAAVHDERRRTARQRGDSAGDHVAVRDEPSRAGSSVGTIPRSMPEPVDAPIPIRRRTDKTPRTRASQAADQASAAAGVKAQLRNENLTAADSRPSDVAGMAALPAALSAPPPLAAPSTTPPDRALAAAVASVEETVARLMEMAARLDRQLPQHAAPALIDTPAFHVATPTQPAAQNTAHEGPPIAPPQASEREQAPPAAAVIVEEPAAVIELPCDEPAEGQPSPHETPASFSTSEPDCETTPQPEEIESEQAGDREAASEELAEEITDEDGDEGPVVVQELEEPVNEVSLELSLCEPVASSGVETSDAQSDEAPVVPSSEVEIETELEMVDEHVEEDVLPADDVERVAEALDETDVAPVADARTEEVRPDDVSYDLAVLRDEILSLARIESPQRLTPCPATAEASDGPSPSAFDTTSRRWPVLHDEPSEDHATTDATADETRPDEAPFDALCRHLHAAIPHGRPTSQMFTTADKQGMAAELAVVLPLLAQRMQQRLLVIDATGGGPGSLTAAWGVKCRAGLTDVLVWNKRWGSHLRSPAESITLLPAAPYGLPRRIPADSLQRLLNEAAANYRVVVVVTSPRGGVDPHLLAPMVDCVYVGLHLAATSPRQALKTIARLQRAQGKVTGCILTGC